MQESEPTLEFVYITFLHRLFTYKVIDELYVPLSDTDKEEQRQKAQIKLQVHPLLSAPLQP